MKKGNRNNGSAIVVLCAVSLGLSWGWYAGAQPPDDAAPVNITTEDLQRMLGMAYDAGYTAGLEIGKKTCESAASEIVPEATGFSSLSTGGGTIFMEPLWVLTREYAPADPAVAGIRPQMWSLVETDSAQVTEKRFEPNQRLQDIWERNAPKGTTRVRVQIEGPTAEILKAVETAFEGTKDSNIWIAPAPSAMQDPAQAEPRAKGMIMPVIPRAKAIERVDERAPTAPTR